MIIDTLPNARHYEHINPHFKAAFAFLSKDNLSILAPGRHDIDGEDIYAIISKNTVRKKSRLESHNKYIDIHFTLSGSDKIGWKSAIRIEKPANIFDIEKDVGFYNDEPVSWINLLPGSFAVFFPEDAHAPLYNVGMISKVVIKVKAAL